MVMLAAKVSNEHGYLTLSIATDLMLIIQMWTSVLAKTADATGKEHASTRWAAEHAATVHLGM